MWVGIGVGGRRGGDQGEGSGGTHGGKDAGAQYHVVPALSSLVHGLLLNGEGSVLIHNT